MNPHLITTSLLKRALNDDLPVWLYYSCAVSSLSVSLNNLSPTRPDIAVTVIVPLSWCAFYFSLSILSSPDLLTKRLAFVGLAIIVIGVPAMICFTQRNQAIDYKSLRGDYEMCSFFFAALILGHVWRRGTSDLIVFFVISAVYGGILENGGIQMGYFKEDSSLVYLPLLVAPLTTMVGWVVVFYLAISLTERLVAWLPTLRGRFLTNGMLAAAVAVSLDLPVDPIATELGIWNWESTLPTPFLGVPLINWFAWIYAVFPFAATYFYLKFGGQPESSQTGLWNHKKLLQFAIAVPFICVVASILFFGTFALIEQGLEGPTFKILRGSLCQFGS